MSLVWGTNQPPVAFFSARTAAKKSLGTAVRNRGHTYLEFQSLWIAVAHRDGTTWSPPTGSRTLRVAATGARERNWLYASFSAVARSAACWVIQPAE